MLVENGFEVVSVDASDKMLKYALKERWNRRRETGFDNWGKRYIIHAYIYVYAWGMGYLNEDKHGLHWILRILIRSHRGGKLAVGVRRH